jgi:hypothetical protein
MTDIMTSQNIDLSFWYILYLGKGKLVPVLNQATLHAGERTYGSTILYYVT